MSEDSEGRVIELYSWRKEQRTPYFMAQLRWALHCYRWKENLSWNEYPKRICKALGLELKDYTEDEKREEARKKFIPSFDKEITTIIEDEKKSSPINMKDPKIWIVGRKEPTKEDKIKAYFDFIKSKAPEYLEAFTDHGSINKTCDFIYRFYSKEDYDDDEIQKLSHQASLLEKYIFLNNSSDYFSDDPNRRKRLLGGNRKIEARYQNIFKSETIVIAFRQIGVTPFLQVYIWGTDCLANLNYRNMKQDAANKAFESFFHNERKRPPDHFKHRYLYTGILCPTPTQKTYIGIAKHQDTHVATIQLMLPVTRNPEDQEYYVDLEGKDRCLKWRMSFDTYPSFYDPASPWVAEPIQDKSIAYKVDFFQNYVANLNA